ncbi:TonB-dependent receptor [Sphingomicrobium flavum]|uniref:TonB-dependent receptor n=1 Tax=Sphingomicrobium flavum TaxID=1229164 RepID=UPI0021AD5283|nr:TonB-dependent siderophore receptor [Sphingomicrobium flavum]
MLIRQSARIVLLATSMLVLPQAAFAAELEGVEIAEDGAEPIIITGVRDGYSSRDGGTPTKLDIDLNDTPHAVAVVTGEQIADQAMRSIADAIRFVPGVTMNAGEGHRDQLAVRGQLTTADFFTDGLRDDVQHYRGLYNVERLEVLKGPNALIFGRGGGGGIVNRVIKRPFADQYLAGGVSIDSEGAGFIEVDLNSPLSGNVDGRLNATYERIDDFRDIEGERFAINPTLRWQIGAATELNIGYEYADDERDVDRGIPPAFDGTIDNPARAVEGYDETFFGIRGVNRTFFSKHVIDARLDHEFSDALSFTSRALYGDYDKLYRNALPSGPVTNVDDVESVLISAYEDSTYRTNFLWQNDLIARFATGGVEHQLLVGVDTAIQDTEVARLRGFFDTLPADQKSANGREAFIALDDPFVIPAITFRGGSGERNATTDVDAIGVYAQNLFSFGETVDVIAGIRHDWIDVRVQDFIGGSDLERSDSLWSPRLGLVYKPNEDISLYASWSRSWLPQSGDQFNSLSPTTAALKPERFTNSEVGVKWRVAQGLDLSIAAYRLDRENTRAVDPLTGDVVITGAQRSEGVEFDVSGKIGKLSLSGGVSIQDAEIRRDTNEAPAGRAVPYVPDFTAAMWGRYDFNDRFGLGLGVSHQSDIFASISNEVVVDGYTLVDAAAFYNVSDNVALQINVENLLGEDGIGGAYNDANLYPIADRKVRATLRFSL